MTRDEIEALLPFLANDTLEGEERATVLTSVEADPALAAELAALTAMRRSMQTEAFETSPGELGLARLMRDIDREEVKAPEVPDNVVPLSRLRIWQIAAVVVMGLGIGQAVFVNTVPAPDSQFELASGGGSEAAFRVIFAPDTTEEELRRLILDAGLEIVGGPSSLGFYDLAPLDGEAGLDEARAALTSAGPIIDTLEEIAD